MDAHGAATADALLAAAVGARAAGEDAVAAEAVVPNPHIKRGTIHRFPRDHSSGILRVIFYFKALVLS